MNRVLPFLNRKKIEMYKYIHLPIILYRCETWSRSSRPGSFTPGKEPPVRIGQEAGWAPEPVWMTCSGEKSCL
jgi:hypothetical protein